MKSETFFTFLVEVSSLFYLFFFVYKLFTIVPPPPPPSLFKLYFVLKLWDFVVCDGKWGTVGLSQAIGV